MFNLDQAIAEWRRQMTAGGIETPAILDELESHLREDVERELRSGPDVERAFTAAVRKIGPASALKKEFEKSTVAAAGEKLMFAAAVLVVAFGAFLSVVTLLLCYRTVAERAMGFIGIGLTFGTICGWPAIVSRLPVIYSKRTLWAVQAACLFAGVAISTFYIQVIVHRFDHYYDGMVPAIGFFGIFPIAVGLALAAGLDRAASRMPRQMMA